LGFRLKKIKVNNDLFSRITKVMATIELERLIKKKIEIGKP
jgi:hypothetical protein